jgi:intracellular septation protein A
MLENVIRYKHTIINTAFGLAFLGMITAKLVIERIREKQ